MGNKKSAPAATADKETWSSVMRDMAAKYGPGALDCLDEWKRMGFPEQGSLSIIRLLALERRLKETEKKLRKKKSVKTHKLDRCDRHKKVISMWMEEAQFRQRESDMRELPNFDSLWEESQLLAPPEYSLREESRPLAPQNSFLSPPPQPPPERANSGDAGTTQPRSRKPQTLLPSMHLSTPGQHGGTTPHSSVTSTQGSTPPHQQGRRGPGTARRTQGASEYCRLHPWMDQEDGDNILLTDIQCPMIEVANPYGNVMMVQRLWSPDDIGQYAATLKTPTEVGGCRWTKELQAFCRTYRPTMKEVLDICAKNMEPSKMQAILDVAQTYQDERPVLVQFEDNRRYMTAVDAVCEKVMTLFPTILNLTEVQNCKQGKDERISQFCHRLEESILTYGGGKAPTDPFAKAFLASQLISNMHDKLSKRVKQSLIGYRTADPADIIKHATHAEDVENEMKEKEKKQEKNKAEVLQLAMMSAITMLSENKDCDRNENRRHHMQRVDSRDYYENNPVYNSSSEGYIRDEENYDSENYDSEGDNMDEEDYAYNRHPPH